MHRRLAAVAAALALACAVACSKDYASDETNAVAEAGVPDATVEAAARPVDASDVIDAGSTDAGSTDADAGSLCDRNPDYVFCDQFNAGTIDPAWTLQSSSNGSTILDVTHAFSAPTSVRSQVPKNDGTVNPSVAVLGRAVPFTGLGTWATYLWLDPIAPDMPFRLFQISFTNRSGGSSMISLRMTRQGATMLFDNGNTTKEILLGIEYPFGQWVEVQMQLDLQAGMVGFQFDAAQVISPIPIDLGMLAASQLTLRLGLAQSVVDEVLQAWYDDTVFVAKGP